MTIHYPLHPHYGCDFPVARRFGTGDTLRLELQANEDCVLVPAWMTDADCCRRLTAGDDPRAALEALLQLASLLDAVDL